MNFLPLCTASVCPTISGIIVDRRDHVLWTLFSFAAFIFSIIFKRCLSMNGPFLTERAIFFQYAVCSRQCAVSEDPYSYPNCLARTVLYFLSMQYAVRSSSILIS